MITVDIKRAILTADAKALATSGPQGVNVVPVSVVAVVDDTIHLYDFFMGKTIENIHFANQAALAVWSGLTGVQIKSAVAYVTTGDMFEQASLEMKERFPDRTLRGILVLTPLAIYDISVGVAAGQQLS